MNKYIKQYLETALWSSVDDNGEPLDSNHSIEDFSVEAREQAKQDITEFFEKAGALLDNYDYETAMHDFWLTRNGHGAGFWDGDYEKDDGEKLTELSKKFGELNVIVDDDGKLYLG